MTAKVVGTIHISPLARLAAEMRANGYPVAAIMMRDPMTQTEPDKIIVEVTRGLWGEPVRTERGLYAPIIDWVLEDGRRFFAKLQLRTYTYNIDTLFSRSERVAEDYSAMQADAIELIKQSCEHPTTRR